MVALCFVFTGTQTNDLHFQAYLMDGLVRWNADHAADATAADAPEHLVYSSYLQSAVWKQCSADVLSKYPMMGL